jgi:hypothetical protein
LQAVEPAAARNQAAAEPAVIVAQSLANHLVAVQVMKVH